MTIALVHSLRRWPGPWLRVAALRQALRLAGVRSAAWAVLVLVVSGCQSGVPGEAVVTVELTTDLGVIELAVYPQRAPISAAGFLAYVDAGLYDGATLYRVVRADNDPSAAPIEVVQGGLLGPAFVGGAEAETFEAPMSLGPLMHETTAMTGLLNEVGTIAFARREPGTASSEFFFNLADNPVLDTGSTERNPDGAGYATFGRVVSGMDVLRNIQALPTDAPKPAVRLLGEQLLNEPVIIRRAQRLEPSGD